MPVSARERSVGIPTRARGKPIKGVATSRPIRSRTRGFQVRVSAALAAVVTRSRRWPHSNAGAELLVTCVAAGTQICVDVDRGLIAILLTNRVYPVANAASSAAIRRVRMAFSNAVLLVVDPVAPSGPDTGMRTITIVVVVVLVLALVAAALAVGHYWRIRQLQANSAMAALIGPQTDTQTNYSNVLQPVHHSL